MTALREALPPTSEGFWAGRADAVRATMQCREHRKIIEERMACVAEILAGVAGLLDPDEIRLHSPLVAEPNALWDLLQDMFQSVISPVFAEKVELCLSDMPRFAPAAGAALCALEEMYPVFPGSRFLSVS